MKIEESLSPICQYEHPVASSTAQSPTYPTGSSTTNYPTAATSTANYGSTTGQGCPAHWKEFQGHCYRFYHTDANWILAQMDCQSVGGNLPSVHSREENTFLIDLAKENYGEDYYYWLGGYYDEQSINHVWIDKSEFDFEMFERNPTDGCLYQNYNYEGRKRIKL